MYRGRFWVWTCIISFTVCLTICMEKMPYFLDCMQTYEIFCTVDNYTDTVSLERMDNITNFKLATQKSDADIIIDDYSEQGSIDGYTKHPGFIYTPLVMYAWNPDDYISGFSVNNIKLNQHTNPVMSCDFKTILTALEDDMEYEDLQIKGMTGKVELAIPDQEDRYYRIVEDLFYATLNNGQMPNESRRGELRNRVNSLLGKCKQITNITEYLYNFDVETFKDKPHNILYIAPECISLPSSVFDVYHSNVPSGYISFYNNRLCPVYITPTTGFYYDLYVKEELDEKVIYKLSKSAVLSSTGFRIENIGYMSPSLFHIVRSPHIVNKNKEGIEHG